ncbi:MAG: amino acid racemase [Patescibacteria group bacterium]
MQTVGIIGGLGPETTSEFYLDLIFSCQKKSRISRPSIIIASVPMPYKIEEDVIEKNIGMERICPYLIAEAKRLEKAGSSFIVMPCNSLHVFINEIRTAVNIPVLSIIEETVKYIKKNNYKKIGIVSTSATIKNKLYEAAFFENKIAYETPDDFQQEKLGKFIHHLVIGQQNNRDREELINIINDFENKKVDAVALACTDLQLLIPKHSTLKIFDTMKIFVDAVVEKLLV